MNENSTFVYAMSLVLQTAIIMAVAYWATGGALATSAYIAGGLLVASLVLPSVLTLLVMVVVFLVAGITSMLNPPLEAPNGKQQAA